MFFVGPFSAVMVLYGKFLYAGNFEGMRRGGNWLIEVSAGRRVLSNVISRSTSKSHSRSKG